MDITVVGPGAVGTLLGGLLSLKGHSVTFRCRQERAQDPPERPLRLVLPDRWLSAKAAFAGPGMQVRKPGAVLVTLARHHLHAVRRPDFPRLVGCASLADAPHIVFVNPDPPEPARLGFDPQAEGRSWSACITLLNAVKLQEQEAELTPGNPVLVVAKGTPGHSLLACLSGFGMTLLPVADPIPYGNALLVSQLLFLPVAMCNMTTDLFLSFPEGRQIARVILSEGLEAMGRAGNSLPRLPAMDPRDLLAQLEKKPDSFARARQAPDRSFNTVLQSFLRGRPSEAAFLNRKAVEIASAAGLHLDWNWRVLQKVGRITSLGFYSGPDELLKALS